MGDNIGAITSGEKKTHLQYKYVKAILMPFFIFFSGNTLTYMRLAWYKKNKTFIKG